MFLMDYGNSIDMVISETNMIDVTDRISDRVGSRKTARTSCTTPVLPLHLSALVASDITTAPAENIQKHCVLAFGFPFKEFFTEPKSEIFI